MTEETEIRTKDGAAAGVEMIRETTSATLIGEPIKPAESTLGNTSTRFWLALVALVGTTAVIIVNQTTGKAPEANLSAGYFAMAGMVVGQYMGQNIRPKTQQQ